MENTQKNIDHRTPYKIVPDKEVPDIIAIMSRDSVKKYSKCIKHRAPGGVPDMNVPDKEGVPDKEVLDIIHMKLDRVQK